MLFRRKREKRSYTLQDEALAKMLGVELDGISSDKAREATFFTCLRILTDTVSKLPLKIHRETNNGVEKANNHYLYSLIKLRPNKYMSASDFWKSVEFNRSYFGHAVVLINTLNNGKVEGLYPLDMSKVTIWYDNVGLIGKDKGLWYVYNDGEVEYKLRSDEVLHFKGMTRDGITGMSVKDYLKTTVENSQYGSDYVNRHFKGGLSATGLLQYTGDIKEEGVNNLKARFEKMATGMDNVGKILPLPIGFNFSTITNTMADSQFLELNQLTIRQIAGAFGIKMHMVNDMSSATYSNISEQMEEFYRDTLHPILTMYEQELTYKLFTSTEIMQGYFMQFNVDAMLRTSLKERYEAYGIGIDKGFLKPNEARAKEDMSNADGGDQLIVNGTYVPLNKVGMHSDNFEAPAPEGGEDSEKE